MLSNRSASNTRSLPAELRNAGHKPTRGALQRPFSFAEPLPASRRFLSNNVLEVPVKGVLAWLIGIPIPIIILLYLVDVF